jgi:hypothetical protein
MTEGRLVALSKVQNKSIVNLDEIHPIVIKSHLSKVMEKAILEKINKEAPHLLTVNSYQRGFQQNRSTMDNVSEVLNIISQQRKRLEGHGFLLFVDLRKAYDSIREKR